MEFRIGCAPDVPLQRLQAFIGLLAQRTGDLRVQVRHLPTALQLRQLRVGDLDVGVLHDAGPSPGIESERLYRGETLAAVVSFAHRVALAKTARLEDWPARSFSSCHAPPSRASMIASLRWPRRTASYSARFARPRSPSP